MVVTSPDVEFGHDAPSATSHLYVLSVEPSEVESSAIEMEDEEANPSDPEAQIEEFKAFLDDVRPDDFAG